MDSIMCGHCDYEIEDIGEANEYQGEVYSARGIEQIENKQFPRYDFRVRYSQDMIECKRCGSLIVETSPGSRIFRQYIPIDDKYHGILNLEE